MTEVVFKRRWHTVAEVAEMLGYGESKVRMLILQGDLKSLKDGRSRRILPEWVDEYDGVSPRSRTRHNGEGSIFPYAYGYRAYVWITTPEGRRQRKYVQAKTREETLEKWNGLQRAAERGPVAPKTPTFAVFRADWLQTVVRPNLAPTTVKNYEMFTRLYIEPDLGRCRLDKLTVRDVQTWVNALFTRCQCCTQSKDAARPTPRCCAKGRCCQQVAKE